MNSLLSKRSILALAAILTGMLLVLYFETRPRLAPGQAPLTDIRNIDTLRTQFNQDFGKTRLIILLSPT
jgi:hypothetical protein